mgnify:CR=1 FL=1
MSMKSYKARGIVLHTLKYGDSGMVVYLLTDSGGRQSYMVQGVRSARGHGSKLALFQPMFAVEFEGLESSRMQMHRFREVRSGIVLQSLPFDVRKSTIALFMAEVLYRLVKLGYVKEDGKQISPDNRVRQYYAITPTGTDYLADLRGEYQELQLAVQQIVEGEKST